MFRRSGGGRLRPTYAALSRLSLAACGWLTLTWLHRWAPGRRWRLLAALPLASYALVLIGCVRDFLQLSTSTTELMLSAAGYCVILQVVFVLIAFVTQHQSLRRLTAQLELLEKRWTDGSSTPGWPVLLQFLLFWLQALSLFVNWTRSCVTALLKGARIILFPMWVPGLLLRPPGLWPLLVFQTWLLVNFCCVLGTFDSCYLLWLRAAGSHLESVRRLLDPERVLPQRRRQDPAAGPAGPAGWRRQATRSGSVPAVSTADRADRPPAAAPETPRTVAEFPMTAAESPFAWPPLPGDAGGTRQKTAELSQEKKVPPQTKATLISCAPELFQGTSGSSQGAIGPASALATVESYYGDVTRFVDAINEATGAASFMTHALTVVSLLVDAYVLLVRLLHPFGDGHYVMVASLLMELVMFVSRLVIFALGGDEVIRQNSAITRSLINMNCRHLPPEENRLRDQLLLKSQQSLCVEPLGFFTVRKSSLLSILGLFLTYFVIIIQMAGSKDDGQL